MDPPREGFSVEQPIKRSIGWPRRTVRESQPSRESFSIPPFYERMEGILELARPSAHGRRPSRSELVGAITQAVVATMGSSSNSRSRRLKAA